MNYTGYVCSETFWRGYRFHEYVFGVLRWAQSWPPKALKNLPIDFESTGRFLVIQSTKWSLLVVLEGGWPQGRQSSLGLGRRAEYNQLVTWIDPFQIDSE